LEGEGGGGVEGVDECDVSFFLVVWGEMVMLTVSRRGKKGRGEKVAVK
jgi:hypothetical protein